VRPSGEVYEPNPIEYLQRAYEQTIKATSEPNKWQGTTTAAGAQLYFQQSSSNTEVPATPLLYVTNLGDSQILVVRPREEKVVYKTIEQWHWFDCPRQLGTNSPDTPRENAVMDKVEIEENDVVLAMSDGVIDNLWEHEIVTNVVESIRKWEAGGGADKKFGAGGGMQFVADRLMNAARVIAQDPFAESPFMEHAIEEGLAMEGGKLLIILFMLLIHSNTR
jgi:protein phosphatase PTC7